MHSSFPFQGRFLNKERNKTEERSDEFMNAYEGKHM